MKYVDGIIWTLALTGFLACTSEDAIDNPGFDPDTNTVKAEVAISIGNHVGEIKTRMADDVTQSNGTFRGIDEYSIYSTNELADDYKWYPVSVGSQLLNTSDPHVKTFRDVRIPIDVDHFLFYGRAAGSLSSSATPTQKQQMGYTIATMPDAFISENSIKFEAVPIAPNYASDPGWTVPSGTLENYLTSIARTTGWDAATNNRLKYLREKFTKTEHFNAGSAPEVLATVQDLYKELCNVRSTASEDQQSLIDVIVGNIKKTAYVTFTGDTEPQTLDWESTFKTNYNMFPENLGIPQGAAQYEYKNRGTEQAPDWGFKYSTGFSVNSEITNVSEYIYPCELYYFAHSPLRAFNGAIEWPTTASDWVDMAASEDWAKQSPKITEKTRSVAMVNVVQYGTAQLATYVKCVPATLESNPVLYDNQMLLDETKNENQPIRYSDNCFPLTGVIIGGQPNKVGWNFQPSSATDTQFKYAVFDNHMTSTIYANEENGKPTSDTDYEDGFCGPNRTLVFDNGGAVGETAIVKVCLEFENKTGQDFFGKDGIIKDGKKFYLVGELDPSHAIGTLPPGVTKRVFIQDFITKAHFTITAGNTIVAGSLGKAYSTIPDLRTTTQELGLSVRLYWKQGLQFKNHPLGKQ